MQRLDRQWHLRGARMVQQFGDGVVHLCPRLRDVLRGRTARPRILRQPADHQHQAGRAQRLGLIDGAAVVVARLDAMRGVGCKHPAAAIARQFEAGVAHRAACAIEPDGRDLIAPRIDGADAVPRAGVDDLQEIALLADSRGI